MARASWIALIFVASCASEDAKVRASAAALSIHADRVFPSVACEAISAELIGVPGLRLTAARVEAAQADIENPAQSYPDHCLVSGALNDRVGSDGKPYATGFELRLPLAWNRRFYFQGGAAMDGTVQPALGVLPGVADNALLQGFAVVSMDGGHTDEAAPPLLGGALFGLDPQARIDYGYAALGGMTSAAKQAVERVYATPIERSYFVGCSNGGRQGMIAATRFAEQYDGIIAGAPGFNMPRAALEQAWDFQQLTSIDADAPAQAFTVQELAFVAERILIKCDALDGAADGIVYDADGCRDAFKVDVDVPACTRGQRTGACLTSRQKRAIRRIVNGPVNSRGEALYADWPWDPGIAADEFTAWRAWKLGTPVLGGSSEIRTLGAASLAYVFTTPPTDLRGSEGFEPQSALDGFLAGFDFDLDAPKILASDAQYTEAADSFMTPPDRTHFRSFVAKRGKLLVYHGAADPVFSANDTRHWYEDFSANVPAARDVARLYLVPGMGHCSGGPSTDRFDAMAALVDWVENGVAPDAIVAHVNPDSASLPADWSRARTRPLCAHPQHAVLLPGATDLESAASFECR